MTDIPKFQKLLKKIDLYGLNFPLRYKGKHEYNTFCGITLSIITIIGITIIVILFLIQHFSRIKVSIIQNSEQLYEKKILNFTRIPILIGFVNDGGRPVTIDPKYLSITLDKNDHYPDKDKEGVMYLRRESKSIKLEYCDINKHFNNDSYIIGMIDDFEYQNYLCAVPGQNLSIAGRYGDSIHGYDILEIHLIKCDNNSNNSSCASEEELNQFYKNSYLSILYLSEALNHYDYKNPIRKTFRSEVFMVVSNSVKRYYYYFAPGEYFSDNGYFLQEMKKFEFFEYDKTDLDFVDEEDQSYYSNSTLIEVSFSSVDKFITFERTYPKIQDSLGNISGWFRILKAFCQIISNFFSEKIFLLDIINKISTVNEKKKINNLIVKDNKEKSKFYNNYIYNDINSKNKILMSRTSIKGYNLKDINMNKTILTNDVLNYNHTSNDDIKNKISFNKKKIQMSYIEYILPFCILRKKDKYSFIIFYRNFIYKDISLEVLIPLIERISKLNFASENSKNNYLSKVNNTFIKGTKKKIVIN